MSGEKKIDMELEGKISKLVKKRMSKNCKVAKHYDQVCIMCTCNMIKSGELGFYFIFLNGTQIIHSSLNLLQSHL